MERRFFICIFCCFALYKAEDSKQEDITNIILLHEKFLQFDWLRAVVFQLNLKYLHEN